MPTRTSLRWSRASGRPSKRTAEGQFAWTTRRSPWPMAALNYSAPCDSDDEVGAEEHLRGCKYNQISRPVWGPAHIRLTSVKPVAYCCSQGELACSVLTPPRTAVQLR